MQTIALMIGGNFLNTTLLNSVIYSIYVRNHSETGDFRGVLNDLDRIANLGVDIIWLMPIHPIGVKNRKGTLGSPYAIQDYKSINPEYGTMDDFQNLVITMHEKGLKCMIDVVYNHTSPDSILAQTHPDYFMQTMEGKLTQKLDDWSDVADFDYINNPELYHELIETLLFWCNKGVDGFRCDVAPLVPIDFWIQARTKVHEKYPDCIFLAESCGLDFIEEIRKKHLTISTDSELYRAFDVTYDYDVKDVQDLVLDGKYNTKHLANRLFVQENSYPANAIKLRFVENHDTIRAVKRIPNHRQRLNWIAFSFFQKGITLLYAGQEVSEAHTPSLFEREPVNWKIKDKKVLEIIKALIKTKKHPMFKNGFYYVKQDSDQGIIHACFETDAQVLQGIFNLGNVEKAVCTEIPDGEYTNLINGMNITIANGVFDADVLPAYIMLEKKSFS